jgi:hypothetical protein
VPDSDKDIILTLNQNLEANDRLSSALDATEEQWPHVKHCWIDRINGEPTPLLAKHRITNVIKTKLAD